MYRYLILNLIDNFSKKISWYLVGHYFKHGSTYLNEYYFVHISKNLQQPMYYTNL